MKVERNVMERARRYFEDKLAFTTGPVELSKAMKEATVVVIDVRAAKDFDQEHIVGSINLPEGQWSTEQGLDGDKSIAVLCYSQVCHLAARAAVEFARRGYSVMELEGGFPAWKSHGLPTEASDATAHDAIDRTRAYLESRRAAEREAPPAKVAPEPTAAPEPKGGARAQGGGAEGCTGAAGADKQATRRAPSAARQGGGHAQVAVGIDAPIPHERLRSGMTTVALAPLVVRRPHAATRYS
ncbi:MAG TPA: rhodanese-like domain-containing protein [Polyangiaceae bacterium]|jgi:rhodanese-related sulfurtransferase|nr:rhodanese-like domain-containing protein [Polyangiaceae bacterium]